MSWQQQLIHHVKGEQRRHSIIGKSFPRFGEGEVEKAPGVTHEGRVAGARRRSFACGHRIMMSCWLGGVLIEPVRSIGEARREALQPIGDVDNNT